MSTTTPTQTSRKNARIADDVDRISDLPDGVISHILSNLPIKDAVRTSVLSKYWESKSTSIYNMHIQHVAWREIFCDPQGMGRKSFRHIVDKILLHLNYVNSFRFVCVCDEPLAESIDIASWMSAVFRRCNIESVELRIAYFTEQENFVLPRSLLSCTSLRSLVVDIQSCIFKVPAKCCFPNLRKLVLKRVKMVNEVSGVGTVKFTFPVLEELRVLNCEWSKVKRVEFFAPSVTSFQTSCDRFADLDGYSINIIGSRLAEFHTHGSSLENCVLTDTTVISVVLLLIPSNSLQWTAAGILGELGSRVRKFLRRVSSVQNLRLTNDVLKAMVQSKASLSLPRYSELKRLNVCSPIELDVDGLLEILHTSPYLEFLFIIMNDGVDEYNYEAIESVPSCILSHLKQITFCYFSWSCKNPQFHLEKFLLKNASELKNVYVTGDSGCNGLQLEKFVNQLSALPKGSNCLKVEAKVHCRQLLNA